MKLLLQTIGVILIFTAGAYFKPDPFVAWHCFCVGLLVALGVMFFRLGNDLKP